MRMLRQEHVNASFYGCLIMLQTHVCSYSAISRDQRINEM